MVKMFEDYINDVYGPDGAFDYDRVDWSAVETYEYSNKLKSAGWVLKKNPTGKPDGRRAMFTIYLPMEFVHCEDKEMMNRIRLSSSQDVCIWMWACPR